MYVLSKLSWIEYKGGDIQLKTVQYIGSVMCRHEQRSAGKVETTPNYKTAKLIKFLPFAGIQIYFAYTNYE